MTKKQMQRLRNARKYWKGMVLIKPSYNPMGNWCASWNLHKR